MRDRDIQYGQSIAGFSVGVIHINSSYALMPGNVQNAHTFRFPVIYEEVALERMDDLFNGAPYLANALKDAAIRLERRGVKAIVGACSSFGFFQAQVADCVSIPVFLSVLTLLPVLQCAVGSGHIGVVCANKSGMNERIYAACGITRSDTIRIRQMADQPEFARFLRGGEIDAALLEAETVKVAQDLVSSESAIKVLVLQCSDLPPFAHAVQRAIKLPIVDATSLVRFAHAAALRSPYHLGLV